MTLTEYMGGSAKASPRASAALAHATDTPKALAAPAHAASDATKHAAASPLSTASPSALANAEGPETDGEEAGGAVVQFAALYQRASRDEEVLASLHEISKELGSVTVQRKAQQQQQQSSITDSITPGATTKTDTGASTARFVPDQLQQLLMTREGGGGEAGAGREQQLQPHPPRTAEAKGKPMRRFLASSATPFATMARASRSSRAQAATVLSYGQDGDAQYTKVQQLPWEDHIIWGVDFTAADDADDAGVVEVEDPMGGVSTLKTVRSNPKTTATATQPKVAAWAAATSATGKKNAASPFGHQSSTKDTLTSGGEADSALVPAAFTGGDAFDMTKPRQYRWELEDDSAKSKKDKPSSTAAGEEKSKSLPCPLNQELLDDSWVVAIGWKSTQEMPESKLVLDDNDASLIYSVPEMEDVRPTLRIPERKLGAAEQRLAQLDKQRVEKKRRIDEVMGNLEFGEETAEGRLGTEGGGKKSKDTRVVKNIGYVHHSLPAIKLSLTKPELPKAKLRDFHRPRGKFKINERLHLVPPPPGAAKLAPQEESAMVTQIKKSSDLNPTAGGKLILVEYTEQRPPMLSNPGMASRILHYWRPPEDENANSLGILGKKKARKTRPKPPDMKMGQVITLGDHDESPFVGDIPPGRVVTSLNSKLFKVPIFPHKPSAPFAVTPEARERHGAELFLMCRAVTKGKKAAAAAKSAGGLGPGKTTVYIMELPEVFTAGQIEPQIEVPAPNSRSANEFIRPYMSFHILRLFKKASDGERLKIEDIARAFPNQSGTAIRKRMKEVATFERGGNDSGWWKKKPASLLQSEEEIRASIPPESVCLYESMMSGHRRLLDIGLTKLFTPSGVNGAINHLIKRLELRKAALSARLIEPQGLEKRAREKAEAQLYKDDPVVRKLEKDVQVARYINEQLQLTPWNLTNNYVECHLQGKGSGMLQLGGIGDPTGRGEGFSFVRVPQSRAKKKDGEEDATPAAESKLSAESAAVQKAVAAVTGTTADLRKLKMKEAGDVLRNLGLADADIKKLRRWDRIHMVRELSSRATAHGVAGSLSKFARGARKSLSAQQQEYRKKCDVIYERQMDVLSSTKTTFSSDEESEGDDDLDEWGADVEADILGGNDSKRGPKNLFRSGGGGLNRSKEVLAEREDAVELRRLMEEMKEDSGPSSSAKAASAARRPDVDSSRLRSQLRASGIREGGTGSSGMTSVGGYARSGTMSRGGSTVSSALATPTDQRSRASSPTHGSRTPVVPSEPPSAAKKVPGRKVLKRTVRTIEEDGSEMVRIQFIVDERQVARFRAMQQRKERQQKTEERNQLRKRKRLLALEDDAASQSLLDKAKRRKQLQEELKQLQRTEAQNKGYQEMLQKQREAGELSAASGEGLGEESSPSGGRGVIRCTQCLQPGHMRTNRSCPLYMADESRAKKGSSSGAASGTKTDKKKSAAGTLAEPLRLKVKKTHSMEGLDGADEGETKLTLNLTELREGARKHNAEKKRKRELEVREQAELYKRPYAKGVAKQSRSRMPVAHLNAALERVVHRLLEMPESELFRAPVDAQAVPDYYQIVKQPMDLGAVRAKIRALAYDSMREFVKDLELIVSNSRMYNGDPAKSLITGNAMKVLRRAQEELAALNVDGGLTPSTPAATTD